MVFLQVDVLAIYEVAINSTPKKDTMAQEVRLFITRILAHSRFKVAPPNT
jgi:hypothetical protein